MYKRKKRWRGSINFSYGLLIMRIVLLGPPGAGKGTQALLLKERFNIPHISTGEIFREEIEKNTKLGLKIKEYVSKGLLVPDNIVIEVVRKRLSQPDCSKGWILDGFPRTVAQARALEDLLKEIGQHLDVVIYLEVPEEEAVKRLLSRGRGDDRICTLKRRFKEYLEKTSSLVDFYKKRNLLIMINGVGSIEEVHSRIIKELRKLKLYEE